jgi:hypothetical protein
MSDRDEPIHVRIDGELWEPANDETAEYDAIHAAAGAVLAGATEVQVIRQVDRRADSDTTEDA